MTYPIYYQHISQLFSQVLQNITRPVASYLPHIHLTLSGRWEKHGADRADSGVVTFLCMQTTGSTLFLGTKSGFQIFWGTKNTTAPPRLPLNCYRHPTAILHISPLLLEMPFKHRITKKSDIEGPPVWKFKILIECRDPIELTHGMYTSRLYVQCNSHR